MSDGATMTAAERWDPPGPGTWERDQSHFQRTVSRLMIDLMTSAAPQGIRAGLDLNGAPIDTMDVRFVNGQMYRRLVPIIGGSGRGPQTPPPPWVIRTVFAVHPRLRKRVRAAAAALDGGPWRAELDRWEREWRPLLVSTNRELARVQVDELSDRDLAAHLDRLITHVESAAVLHFRLHVSDLGPIALLLDHGDGWGLDQAAVMSVLAGASPATSAPQDALRSLARELAAAGVDPAAVTSFHDVTSASARAAELLDAYLVDFGTRLTTGYDLTDSTLGELPDLVLASLADERLLTDGTAADHALERGAEALAELREHVPSADRGQFDRLVEDARRVYGLRDENGPITVEWPSGVLRMALLEVGRRMVASGRLLNASHVFNLGHHELVGMLRGEVGPKAEAIATRDAVRRARADTASPPHLGPAPILPDLDGLPVPMQRMMRMTMNVLELLEAVPDQGELRGTGIGTSAYTGVARVVLDADEALERVEPGDVVITLFTAPTFNAVLAIAGAVVTEHGGLLCHTAVIARELGITAVVGAAGATSIADGATVLVDPIEGRVTVVEPR